MNETSANTETTEIKVEAGLDNKAVANDMTTMSDNCDEMAVQMLYMAKWFRNYRKPLSDAVSAVLCTYCKAKLPEADLKAHIETCDKHPLSAAKAKVTALENERDFYKNMLKDMSSIWWDPSIPSDVVKGRLGDYIEACIDPLFPD